MKPRNRPRWKSAMSSPLLLIAALIVLVFLLRAVWNIRAKADLGEARLVKAQAKLVRLQSDQVDLTRKAGDLSTDAGIEIEMREKYRAVGPGESVAVIIDSSVTARSVDIATGSPADSRTGFWRGLLEMLGFL